MAEADSCTSVSGRPIILILYWWLYIGSAEFVRVQLQFLYLAGQQIQSGLQLFEFLFEVPSKFGSIRPKTDHVIPARLKSHDQANAELKGHHCWLSVHHLA